METELESNVGDSGESLPHNRIVPLKEAEAILLFSGLISTENTEPRCPRNWAGLSLSVIGHGHIRITESAVAEAMNLFSGSKATRQMGPDSSSPKMGWTFSSIFHAAMRGLAILGASSRSRFCRSNTSEYGIGL